MYFDFLHSLSFDISVDLKYLNFTTNVVLNFYVLFSMLWLKDFYDSRNISKK